MLHRFICEEYEEFGTNGWRLESQPGFDPLPGMAVAHDILEHFPGGGANPTDEYMAFGALLWVRRDYWSYKSHFHPDPGYHVSADLPRIFRGVIYGDDTIRTAPRTYRCEADDQIDIALSECAKNLKDEFDAPRDRNRCRAYFNDIRGWMRIGYRRAKRRYRHNDQWDVMKLFQHIEKKADEYLKYASIGDVLEVKLNIRRAEADMRVISDYEEY